MEGFGKSIDDHLGVFGKPVLFADRGRAFGKMANGAMSIVNIPGNVAGTIDQVQAGAKLFTRWAVPVEGQAPVSWKDLGDAVGFDPKHPYDIPNQVFAAILAGHLLTVARGSPPTPISNQQLAASAIRKVWKSQPKADANLYLNKPVQEFFAEMPKEYSRSNFDANVKEKRSSPRLPDQSSRTNQF